MSQTTSSFWQNPEKVSRTIQAIVDLRPALSSKGKIECPHCHGVLLWARDYQGYIYIRCQRRCEEYDDRMAEGRT